MPYSYANFKGEIGEHIKQNVNQSTKILDVGPGFGIYGLMLVGYDVDAVEIHQPYIDMFNLNALYINVHIGDIREFDISEYEYIIMGDILEHLTTEEALQFLNKCKDKKVMVAVPYMFEQGEEFGNIYETHHQSDLTEDIMLERYPMLNLLFGDGHYGYFINY